MADTSARYVLETLRMTAGLLIWAAHLGVAYAVVGVACARGGMGAAVVWSLAAVTVVAVVAALVVTVAALRGNRRGFERRLTALGGAAGALAIVWDGLPLLLLPGCGGGP